MNLPNEPSFLVVGVHQSTEAYPNTLYRVSELRERFNASEIDEPLWSTPTGGWTSMRSPLRALWRAIVSHVRIALQVALGPRRDAAYVPYPAPTVMLLLSFFPRWKRPRRIVVDAFISLYDTVVNDRKLWSPRALRSQLLRTLERRAFTKADAVVVDTPQNADFYAETFHLPRAKFVALPLATNEGDYAHAPYRPVTGRCRVLFMGTLVPLHGIGTIIGAARLLSARRDIEFRIFGTGIDAPKLQVGMEGLTNVVWQPRWHTAGELAHDIVDADICLGIFGDSGKAQRVCPYKLYSYASVGRATITGDTDWLRSVTKGNATLPFRGVPISDPQALADAIVALADDPDERLRMAQAARSFYESHLANAVSMEALSRLLHALAKSDGE
jgi:glycosyltransferase involved in cell wall biosynthesis